jgi:hypothetical protein
MKPQIVIHEFSPGARSLRSCGQGAFRLGRRVQAALATAASGDWTPTGIGRGYYLDVMERIVCGAVPWVRRDGRVMDPIVNRETGQVSPRFASSAAILLHFGRAPGIRETALRSMTHCCRALADGEARALSPDFWTREIVTAYLALRGVAGAALRGRWAADLSAFEPEQLYSAVRPDGRGIAGLGNWAVYSSAGESMRESAGLRPGRPMLWGNRFLEKYAGGQFARWTADGMYRDPGDPITYDITTRLQVACALAFGYRGRLRPALEELLRRGGLTTLLFVSPGGHVPYGGRSAAFSFREAIIAALCELEARRYRDSEPALAGAFKRQAHLSALAMRRWVLDMKPWRHIQNGFPPAALHGIDAYGNYGVYSLLISSFLGLAALFADETIPEAPCPSDAGGFAFAVSPAFHKAFGQAAGTYVEIDLRADPRYDATGLGRFCRRGVPIELGAGMPFPGRPRRPGRSAIRMGPGQQLPDVPTAVGPEVRVHGRWLALAAASGPEVRCRVRSLEESPGEVALEVIHRLGSACVITQRYRVSEGRLVISCAACGTGRARGAAPLRFVVPLLVTDGQRRSRIRGPRHGAASVNYRGHRLVVEFDPACRATLEARACANRHGAYRPLRIRSLSGALTVTLTLI